MFSDSDHSHKLAKRCRDRAYDVIFQGGSNDKAADIGVFLRNWGQVQTDRMGLDKVHHSLSQFQAGKGCYYMPPGSDAPFFGARRLVLLGNSLVDEKESEKRITRYIFM